MEENSMKEYKSVDSKVIELKRKFHVTMLPILKNAKRPDIISAYMVSVLDDYDRKFGVRGYQQSELTDGRVVISRKFGRKLADEDRSERFGKRFEEEQDGVGYYQKLTEESLIMSSAYNEYVVRDGKQPSEFWRADMRAYVPQSYMNEVAQLEKYVCDSKNPWDMCIVASSVPYSNVRKLENAVISAKNPLAVLEFASSVSGADLYKLRDAISTMEDKEILVSGKKVDYLSLFDEKFNLPGTMFGEPRQPE